MISITGNNITLTRGDTLRLGITVTNADGSPFAPAAGDAIRFAMKKHYFDRDTLIHKDIDMETMVLHLASSDTTDLGYGDYVYDIELTLANGDVNTFISGKLKLTEEVE